jgi:hypothetical protein
MKLLPLLLLCSSLLCAQTSSESPADQQARASGPERQALAQQWLRDARPLYRAWAADIIRRDHLDSLTPQLIDAIGNLDSWPAAGEDVNDEDRARFAILDALIELQADVHKSTVLALFSRYPAQALILALRSKSWSVEDAFDLLALAKANEYWLAIVNWLTTGTKPGVAAWLLREVRVKATIVVFEDDGPGPPPVPGGIAGGVLGGIIGGNPTPAPSQWPDTYNYMLALSSEDNSVLLADGPHPIYYCRVIPGWRIWHQNNDRYLNGDRNVYLHEYLASLLSTPPESLPIVLEPHLTHKLTSPEKYRAAAAAFVAEQERKFREVVDWLYQGLKLTPLEQFNARLSISVEADDHRWIRSIPLPALPK